MGKLSKRGINLLVSIETLQVYPYDDQTGKRIYEWVPGATIGVGKLLSKQEFEIYKDGITEEQAYSLFYKDLAPFEDCVSKTIKTQLTQEQFDACVMLAYNIGCASFRGSSVAKILNGIKTKYSSLDDAWLAWNKSQGKVMKGLTNRRKAELNIFHRGIYERW